MIIHDEILIFHALRHRDDQLIVEGLARNHGRISFVVRISHAPRAKIRHTIFQPMAVLEVEWEEKPRAKLMRPISARVAQPWRSLHTSPIKATLTLFLAEFLMQVCRHEQSGELFLIISCIASHGWTRQRKDMLIFICSFSCAWRNSWASLPIQLRLHCPSLILWQRNLCLARLRTYIIYMGMRLGLSSSFCA